MVEGAYVEASIRRDVGGHIRQVKGQFPNLRWEDTDRPVQRDICSWIGRASNNDAVRPFMGLQVCEIHTRVSRPQG